MLSVLSVCPGIPAISLYVTAMTRYPLISAFLCFLSLVTFAQPEKSVIPEQDITKSLSFVINTAVATLVDTVEHSVLHSGSWYKVKVSRDGIYKLTYEDISDMGFPDPENVRIYGNGGAMLPLMNNEPRIHDLAENAIYMYKGTDGVFSQGDFILFYGRGPVTWEYDPVTAMFEHVKHLFSNASYYFVTTGPGPGKRITDAELVAEPPDITVNSFDNYAFHEINRYNFLKSGRQWFGERIDYADYDTSFLFQNLIASSPVMLKSNVVSRSANTKTISFKSNGLLIGTISISGVNLANSTGVYANQKSDVFSFMASADQVLLNVSYNKTNVSDEGFIDYIILNARCELDITGDAFFFRDRLSMGPGTIAEFTLNNAGANTVIWNLSGIYDIKRMQSQVEEDVLTFKAHADSLTEYVAVNTMGTFPKPVFQGTDDDIGVVQNQNLHHTGPHQMLIVTHPLFREAADSLAELHRMQDGLTVFVATTEAIYNEFSSGAIDVSAIRDFSRLLYNRATGDHDRLRYLMLVGDGSYNNHTRGNGNPNFIPTYQSESSLNASTSYVSDDFFGFMDEEEGGSNNMEAFMLDLGVGRLPVKTAGEAMILYRKIKFYTSKRNMLDWRNNILFAGDDEDVNIHMTQANGLADWVRAQYPQFHVKKVLLDAYNQVSTSTGTRYPDVNRIIYENMHKGMLIFNYTGHGGERGLAAEQIMMREDLQEYTNYNTMPLFVTATCEFSRFDDLSDEGGILLESTSAGETSLLNPDGGSIGLLSTTRIAYSDRNHYLNTQFYRIVFERDQNGKYYKLGDVIRMTKDSTGVERNKLNFILLGDPALTLAIPDFNILTDSLNGTEITLHPDTLKAFSRIRISGHLEDENQNLMEDFNGIIYPSVFDKVVTVTTLANDGGEPMNFETQENLIFKGKASVTSGRFTFEFTVPKDISYSYGNGKLIYYAQNSSVDAHGHCEDFIIGGTFAGAFADHTGPEIMLYLNDESFNNQGISNPSPVIYARITDESGINTVGNGIGHDITGIIDNDLSGPIILNDFYETDLDDFTSGTLRYQMHDLAEGWHSLKVKAWDVFNNSSEATIEFRVLPSDVLMLANAYNYPNPASDHTIFQFEHNQPDEELTVNIYIFDLSGRMVATIENTISSAGFSSSPIYWDLKDQNGNYLRQGVYPYRMVVRNKNGSHADRYEKLVVIRQ
ncbi:MAG: type IX secretion system sortase PorU [Bacteroidales bacterium]|nr:type IX secretion system sortase PorU [Bacteroidales bacterium]